MRKERGPLSEWHAYAGKPALRAAIGSPEQLEVARECGRASLVLLKNARHSLLLSKKPEWLGKTANNLGIQCGGWTISWRGGMDQDSFKLPQG